MTDTTQLSDDVRLLNRELSWLEFNARVLQQGMNSSTPLLEQLKFLAIFSSNLDEFFMVRVASLKRTLLNNPESPQGGGLTAQQAMQALSRRIHTLVRQQEKYLINTLIPALANNNIALVRPTQYDDADREHLRDLFDTEIFPVLTPMVVHNNELPYVANRGLQLAFRLSADGEPNRFAVLPIPDSLERFHHLTNEPEQVRIGLLEDIIRQHASVFFPHHHIVDSAIFRVTRDADLGVDEERDEDFLEAMTAIIQAREFSAPVRLEIETDDSELRKLLVHALQVQKHEVYDLDGPVDIAATMALLRLSGFETLRDKRWTPRPSLDVPADTDLFSIIRRNDVLLHHPYDAFDPVIRLFTEAATDPDVLAIKTTLYRTSRQSPIIDALIRAAGSGKQVTALVELKARFDEERNITWAQRLERAGVIVVYGIVGLKVHSKATLVIRRECDGIVRYAHLGTGNYNEGTAALYTDMGLLTSREELTHEVTLCFNAITGYSAVHGLHRLIMAPHTMRPALTRLITREIERSSATQPGLIIAKLNSLVDPGIIDLLYSASKAGVKIKLNIRGICCLRPGVKGLSENIEVVSVVDRFLEHSRIIYFHNDGANDVYLSSADWMPRNIDRRVELMFPIDEPRLRRRIIRILKLYFEDTTNAWQLQENGRYKRLRPRRGHPSFRIQQTLCEKALGRHVDDNIPREFQVRRKPD